MTAEIIGGVGIIMTGMFGLLIGWVRWSIRTAVKEVVNGRIENVIGTVNRIEDWTKRHDGQHNYDRNALLSALHRQGVDGPDGWPTIAVPPDALRGEEDDE